MNANSRNFTRINIPLRVVIASDHGPILETTTCNLSMTGALLDGKLDLNEAQSYKATIMLDESGQVAIDTQCTIMRTDDENIGIRFDNIELDGYMHLKNIIMMNAISSEAVAQEFESHHGIRKIDSPE